MPEELAKLADARGKFSLEGTKRDRSAGGDMDATPTSSAKRVRRSRLARPTSACQVKTRNADPAGVAIEHAKGTHAASACQCSRLFLDLCFRTSVMVL